MRSRRTILWVNRWRGLIGPNVGMRQVVSAALARGHVVHVASPWQDEFMAEVKALGAQVHLLGRLDWTPRSKNPWRQMVHALRGLWQARQVGALARAVAADVICINGENALWLPRAGRLAGVPTVIITRGLRFEGLGRAGRSFFGLQQRWTTKYIAVSQAVAQALASMSVPRERIAVVYNGVDLNAFRPGVAASDLAPRLGLPPGRPIVATVCHLEPRKGVQHLLEAFRHLSASSPQAVGMVVGDITNPEDEAYVRDLHEQVRRPPLAGRVFLVGRRADVPDILRLAAVVAHPSETESFGRAIAEAMACGKPVVGFDVGAVPELLQPPRCGLVAPAFDTEAFAAAIARLLDDPSLRAALGQAGRARAEECFDVVKNAEAAVDVLEAAAERTR